MNYLAQIRIEGDEIKYDSLSSGEDSETIWLERKIPAELESKIDALIDAEIAAYYSTNSKK